MENAEPIGDQSQPAASENVGGASRKVGELASFQSANGNGAPSASGGSAPSGKSSREKKKIGRPPKSASGFSEKAIAEAVDDPEIEAARAEFEGVLVELLVSTTDGIADRRFEILKLRFPEEVAQGMANKARLTDKEKKYFGGVAVRLWRKYLGDKYIFSDEGIAGLYLIQYLARNVEGMSQVKKAKAETNAKSNDKQSGLPSTPSADLGTERNGKNGAGDKVDLLPSRTASPYL